jgi:hypothetical protein
MDLALPRGIVESGSLAKHFRRSFGGRRCKLLQTVAIYYGRWTTLGQAGIDAGSGSQEELDIYLRVKFQVSYVYTYWQT